MREVLPRVPELCVSVSATTRDPRPGEVDGVDYLFLEADEFEQRIRDGAFIEWAEVHGHRYGTPERWVDDRIAQGKAVILEIDVQGACQVRARRPDTHLIFVTAPSIDDLKARMTLRGAESEDEMGVRLARAEEELALAGDYEDVIVNDDVSRAASELEDVIRRILLKDCDA